jgi:hypothetical protein
MLDPVEKQQFDRIEAKLDRLLLLLDHSSPGADDRWNRMVVAYAHGGVQALKECCKAESEARANAYALKRGIGV